MWGDVFELESALVDDQSRDALRPLLSIRLGTTVLRQTDRRSLLYRICLSFLNPFFRPCILLSVSSRHWEPRFRIISVFRSASDQHFPDFNLYLRDLP